MAWPVTRVLTNQGCDHNMRDGHEYASIHEELASSETIQRPQTADNTDQLRNIEDTRHDELHVVIEAHSAE